MLEFNQGKRDPMHISEKHDSNNILYNIEKFRKKIEKRNLKPYLIKIQQLNIIIKSKKCMKILKK